VYQRWRVSVLPRMHATKLNDNRIIKGEIEYEIWIRWSRWTKIDSNFR